MTNCKLSRDDDKLRIFYYQSWLADSSDLQEFPYLIVYLDETCLLFSLLNFYNDRSSLAFKKALTDNQLELIQTRLIKRLYVQN